MYKLRHLWPLNYFFAISRDFLDGEHTECVQYTICDLTDRQIDSKYDDSGERDNQYVTNVLCSIFHHIRGFCWA